MRTYLAALTLLMALNSGGWTFTYPDSRGWTTQPDGTILHYSRYGDTYMMHVDGFVIIPGSGGWYYYAELDARGEYEPSPYKVGIDDPYEIGIPRNLQPQRSAVRQAEMDAAGIMQHGAALYLTQPNGIEFTAWDYPLPTGTFGWCTSLSMDPPEVDGDGYVISIGYDNKPLINYGAGHPFWAFVYDDESGWYYYAERLDPNREYEEGYAEHRGYILNPQGEYVASPYKVGIDPPPYYDRTTDAIEPPPTAVQQRSWGGLKNLFHK